MSARQEWEERKNEEGRAERKSNVVQSLGHGFPGKHTELMPESDGAGRMRRERDLLSPFFNGQGLHFWDALRHRLSWVRLGSWNCCMSCVADRSDRSWWSLANPDRCLHGWSGGCEFNS